MRCPYCGSTDIADTIDDRRMCLDCQRIWIPKTRIV